MKRRYLSCEEWKCILKKELQIEYVRTDFFNGFVGRLHIFEVTEPQIWNFNGEQMIVCKEGYRWVSLLPKEDFYCITAMMNPQNEILVWYIDMIAAQGISKEKIPYFDDLYLDLVVYPNGTIIEDDRDELEEALEKEDITKEQYQLANDTCRKLKEGLLSDIEKLKQLTYSCQKQLLDISRVCDTINS